MLLLAREFYGNFIFFVENHFIGMREKYSKLTNGLIREPKKLSEVSGQGSLLIKRIAERYDVVTILGVTTQKDVDINRIFTGYNGDAMAMGGLMIIDIPHEYHPTHEQILSFKETVRKVTQLYSIERVYPYAYHRRMWVLRYRGEL